MTIYQVPVISQFVWQPPVIDKDLTAPPGGESKGDRYIVGASATGAWSGEDDNIAQYNGSGWDFIDCKEGMITWVKDEDLLYTYDGSDWAEFSSGASPSPRTSETKTANYTVVAGDGGKTIEMDNAAARAFTMTAASTLGRGWWCRLVKEGAGDVSIIPGGSDTIGRFGNNTIKNEQADEAGWAFLILEVAYDEAGFLTHGDGTWNT